MGEAMLGSSIDDLIEGTEDVVVHMNWIQTPLRYWQYCCNAHACDPRILRYTIQSSAAQIVCVS
jgi:hypothetical protein